MPILPAAAEVIASTESHYQLQHKAVSSMPPNELWQRLINPSEWWHPDHTYSGRSENLSLDAKAGGLWREDWDGNSVLHGSVLQAQPGKLLKLDAPFGPLQDLAVTVVWTISLEAQGEGTLVTFTELANGSESSQLKSMATAVDFVKGQAIQRLVATTPE